MLGEPTVAHPDEREWETWPPEQADERGTIFWKTLLSSEQTPSEALTVGVAKLPPGGELKPHRHSQPEVYFVLEGRGVATINEVERPVGRHDTVFFPGDAVHSIRTDGAEELQLAFVFAADSVDQIHYVFEPSETQTHKRTPEEGP
jgi:mannose-6-phosphate isomerase-like protein (cupin superfamily)